MDSLDRLADSHSRPRRPPAVLAAGIFGAALALSVAAIFAVVLGGAIARNQAATPAPRVKDYTRELQDCAGNANQVIQAAQQDFSEYQQIWTTCANQIYLVDLMEDFDIRREKLIRQELDERVILWMVVAITMSGVLLAGLQLLGSYRLAAAGTDKFGDPSTISVEAGKQANKVSVQSSVTGLMILVVSLAFFIVYVKWIYSIQEISIEKPQSLNQAPPGGKIVGVGTLTPRPAPPATPSPPAAPAPAAKPKPAPTAK